MASKRPPLPFAEIARYALGFADALITSWLPAGKKVGHEWSATNPNRADNNAGSFSVNLNTGEWGDFATDDKGGDLISLYAYLQGLEQYQAALEVADAVGFTLPDGVIRWRAHRDAPAPKPRQIALDAKPKKIKTASPWVPVLPVPADAPAPHKAHEIRGVPQATWAYRDAAGQLLGYIYRFVTSDGGKETIPHTYCRNSQTGQHEWRWMQLPDPRPLYGLDRLAAHPDAWVLLVEGEKCADAPLELIKGVPVSWPGGSKAVDKADFSPLAGRKVYAWADCDAKREPLSRAEKEAGADPQSKPLLPEHKQPGMKAMLQIRDKLLALEPPAEFHLIDIPAPLAKPDGWDIADAIAEGMDAQALTAFILRTRELGPALTLASSQELPAAGHGKPPATPPKADAGEDEDGPAWRRMLLFKKGDMVACLANVYDILANDSRWAGVLAYDEFSQRVMKLKPPPYYERNGAVGEWDVQDDIRTAMWLTRTYRLNITPALASEGVEAVARSHVINPPKDWMRSLEWDGVNRLDLWMRDFMDVPITKYSKRVARWFFMGMVKRVMEPGCQFDYCLVLEGPQGKKKSSALAVIGGDWFGDTDLDLNNKDSMSALRGKMLYEFSEMGSVARAEATKQKSFLTRRIDEYRPVYGRREIRCPRQLVFCGSTNEWEWNKDPTGGRRFWPVMVQAEIDVEGLREVRDQLFAEAVAMVDEGLRYWPNAQEQAELFDPEQLRRTMQEAFVDMLHDHVMSYVGEFSLAYAAKEWLGLDASKITRDIQTRIGSALYRLGCSKHDKGSKSLTRFVYKAPERNGLASDSGQAVGKDDDDIPF
ncbi:VapE domain-containing protein [Methylobacillus flagellatus]|uniref:VapE domain-containing protein n=1 Tax=Methylobacillus flagellatus TaxID=405 RepID=UPI0010F863EC|nr:VapE domain-containing protein [Methylobacillus flagellatus]